MNEKSYVAMGYDVCPVCGIKHNEVVLLNKRLDKSFTQRDNFMGFSLCDEHEEEIIYRRYIALVELASPPKGKTASLKDTWESRTGRFLMMREEVFADMFDVKAPKNFCFIEPELFNTLAEMTDKE